MRHRALILEPSKVFQSILRKILESAGVECKAYDNPTAALDDQHGHYTFIIVSRTLDLGSGEDFYVHYKEKFGTGDALPILMLADSTDQDITAANQAGFKLIFSKKKLVALQGIVTSVIKKRADNLNASILLVEDSKSTALGIIELFRMNGSVVHHAMTLNEAKGALDKFEVDLVISDYLLSTTETGNDIITHVRNHRDQEKSQLPILIVSGESDQKMRVSFLRNGANDFILKPYDPEELLVRSRNLVKSHRLLQEAHQQRDNLEKLALTDQLTSLYNRHSLYNMANKVLSSAVRNLTPVSLFIIDLDYFKNINDTYGHTTGDIVLKTVASVLQSQCRNEDIVARFGGEEFVILLPQCNLKSAQDIAERIRLAIMECKPEDLEISASIGISQLTSEMKTFEDLFDPADQNLYTAKENGRNCVVP